MSAQMLYSLLQIKHLSNQMFYSSGQMFYSSGQIACVSGNKSKKSCQINNPITLFNNFN